MKRQRLLRALLVWVVLVMIPLALVLTGRVPRSTPWINNGLSVVTLVATLILAVYVMSGEKTPK
jgi:hypothetical protein